jgi:hypothetical protein
MNSVTSPSCESIHIRRSGIFFGVIVEMVNEKKKKKQQQKKTQCQTLYGW